jgi:hypothetical protein
MYKKYQKNWEEIRRLRGYVRDKYKRVYVPFKPTKMIWVSNLICFILFAPAFILLLWLYVTEHNSSLIILLFFMGAFCVITVLYLWKFKSVFWNTHIDSTKQDGLHDEDKTDRKNSAK